MKVEELQNIAFSLGLVIKIQVRETIGLCFFKNCYRRTNR